MDDDPVARIASAGPRALTPDVPVEVRHEIAKAPARFETFLRAAEKCARLRHVVMQREQRAIARELEATSFKAVDGLGVPYLRITQEEYLAMRAKYGDECWNDPAFIEAYRRDNEYCRIKVTRGTRGQEYGGRPRRQPDRHRPGEAGPSQYGGLKRRASSQ